MIVYLILYGRICLNMVRYDRVCDSEVMFVRSRRFLLINTVNVGQFESVSSRDTDRDGSY